MQRAWAYPRIRLDHVHNGTKFCFLADHRLKEPRRIQVGPNLCTVAYYPYTGRWYAWNDDGKEIASFTRDYFERFIEPLSFGPLEPDPDCGPLDKSVEDR